jgi:uncharacterized UPF0146 family protein
VPTLDGLEAGENGLRVVLAAEVVETGEQHPVIIDHVTLQPENALDQPLDWPLQSLGRPVIPIEGETHRSGVTDGAYKRIERTVGAFIGARYRDAVEVGIGRNTTAAETIAAMGARVRAVDIRPFETGGIPFAVDDIFSPDLSLYRGADLIYAVRPGIEMVPPLIALARLFGSDLLVYHLGDERYLDGGERIPCGEIVLHRYHRASSEEG